MNSKKSTASRASEISARIAQATTAEDPNVVKSVYEDWAQHYDDDITGYGYVAPAIATECFITLLPDKSSLVYDAGCGTGLIGQRLKQAGYNRLHGADFSAEMLEIAKKGLIYESLRLADYSKQLPELADNSYDGIISVGVYCTGFRSHFLNEMVRILKPGGALVFTSRSHFFQGEIEDDLNRLERCGAIVELNVSLQPYMQAQGTDAYYISARKVS